MRFSSTIILARCEPAFRTRRSWLCPRGGWRARVQSAFWLSARCGAGRHATRLASTVVLCRLLLTMMHGPSCPILTSRTRPTAGTALATSTPLTSVAIGPKPRFSCHTLSTLFGALGTMATYMSDVLMVEIFPGLEYMLGWQSLPEMRMLGQLYMASSVLADMGYTLVDDGVELTQLPDGSDVILYEAFHRLDFNRLDFLRRQYYTRWAFDSWMEVLLVPLRPPHTMDSLYGDDYGEFDSEDEFHVFAQRQFQQPDSDDDRPSHPW